MKVSHSCRGAYMYLSNHFGPHYGFLGKELSDMHIWSRKTLKRTRFPHLKWEFVNPFIPGTNKK